MRKAFKAEFLMSIMIFLCLSGCSFTSVDDSEDNSALEKSDISENDENEDISTNHSTEIITYRDASSVYESPTGLLESNGGLGQGFYVEGGETDSYGRIFTYKGGEAELPLDLDGSGTTVENGIGILVFLDGKPQPYRVEGGDGNGDESYAWIHFFYPSEEGETYDVRFVPVTGKSGDTLEMYTININNPNYRLSSSINGHYQTGGSIADGTRLKFEADPGEVTIPSITDRNVACNISYEDLTDEDIEGISSSDLSYEVYSNFYADGILVESTMYFYGTTEEDTIHLRYETFGTTADTYGLIFYLDHEPLLVDGEAILIEVQSGKKTIVELEFDMTGFDGGSVLYAVRIPRNYKTLSIDETVGDSGWPLISNTIYLTSAASRDELQ